MGRKAVALLAAIFLSIVLPGAARTARDPIIAIIPLGSVEEKSVKAVSTALTKAFPVRITVAGRMDVPSAARSGPRGRFSATALLEHLSAMRVPEAVKVVGVTSEDITLRNGSVPDWGVFGASFISGRSAIVATHRLRARSDNGTTPKTRTGRVAVHELGHAMGLGHCASSRCIMEDVRGSIRPIDHTAGLFCPLCREWLRQAPLTIPGRYTRNSPTMPRSSLESSAS